MRKTWAAGAAIVLSVALGTLPALAQDEDPDPMAPSHFTMSAETVSMDDQIWVDGPGYGQAFGQETVVTTDASDPRMSGTWTQVVDARAFPIDMEAEDWAVVWSGVVRLENEDGAWVGTLDGYENGTAAREWNRLDGEGAYEGLTAIFRWVEEGNASEGVIIPGLPPAYPDPIVPESVGVDPESPGDEPAVEPTVGAGTAGVGRAPWPSVGCGTASATAGTSHDSMEVADLVRSWYAHVPPAHDGQTPLPLVIQLHGNGGDATIQADLSGLDALGDEQGFVTVTPEGRGQIQHWIYENDERGWDVSPTNPDVLFIGALIDRLGQQLCLDLARVYVTGMSNGGQAATALACVLDARIAAIAPISGLVDSGDGCNTARPVPMLAFYGQADPITPFAGGMSALLAGAPTEVGVPLGDMPFATIFDGPVTERVAGIAKRYGCAPDPTAELVAGHVERITYACPDGADVELVLAKDGGHAWPGHPWPPRLEYVELQGPINMEIDASHMMWDFLAQHALPEG